MSAAPSRFFASAMLTLVLCFAGCSQAPTDSWNVLVISVDTLRHDFLGCYGDPHHPSPTLDRLARRGTLYSVASATSSWTLPSHMSLLTGQYPSEHGLVGDGRALPLGKYTLTEFLKRRGYRTAGFASGPYLHRGYGFDRGFDTYEHCVAWGEEVNEDGRIKNVISTNLRSHHGVTSPQTHGRVAEWLETHRVGKPFFLFVHYWDPHYDFTPPEPWNRSFNPGYDGRIDGNGFLQSRRIVADMPQRDFDHLLHLYRGEIRYTDRWIETLLRILDERGELDRTIVVLVADHGEEFFEHGNKGHRENLYDETLRIPMIVALPEELSRNEHARGKVVDLPVSLVDVFPSIVGALSTTERAPVSDDRLADHTLSGIDLLQGEDVDRAVLAELGQHLVSVRTRDWKLMVERSETVDTDSTDGSAARELYDLERDPGEARNVLAANLRAATSLLDTLRAGPLGSGRTTQTPEASIDSATEEALRSLGYTD